MRIAMAHAWPLPPAIASRCAENDGSCRRRRRSPTPRCSASPARTIGPRAAAAGCSLRSTALSRPAAVHESAQQRGGGGCITCMRSCPNVRAFGELRAPQRAAIDILPFQLEPALALVRGTCIAISARRRSRARQDHSGRPDARGVAPARLVRARAHRHACRAAATVGRRAAASIRHSRRGRGRGVARGAYGFAAVRRESVDRRARRDCVDRLSQAARGASRSCRAAVGRADCRRGASRDDRIPSLRRRQRAGRTRAARGAPHRHSACRRRSRVSSALRDRRSRRARSDASLPPNAGTGGPAAIAPRASAARDAHAG